MFGFQSWVPNEANIADSVNIFVISQEPINMDQHQTRHPKQIQHCEKNW